MLQPHPQVLGIFTTVSYLWIVVLVGLLVEGIDAGNDQCHYLDYNSLFACV